MKTSSAKAKGRRCAKEVKDLMHFYDADLQDDDINVTSSGETGEDLKLSPRARQTYPLSIECKNVEKLNIWQALEQTESHVKEGRLPILFFRRNRSKLYCTLEAKEFLALIAFYRKLGQL